MDSVATKACDGCDGSGIRPDSENHSTLVVPEGFTVIERCDMCQRYENDLEAAQAFGDDASDQVGPSGFGWVTWCRPRMAEALRLHPNAAKAEARLLDDLERA